MKVVLLTNAPSPYRAAVYERCAAATDLRFHVVFCREVEPNRKWQVPTIKCSHTFLNSPAIGSKDGVSFMYWSSKIVPLLLQIQPDAVITCGFSPTYLLAQIYCLLVRIPHIYMTDGTPHTEHGLSIFHRIARRIVFPMTTAFIAASNGSQRLLNSYKVPEARVFRSPLCVDNSSYLPSRQFGERAFDFAYIGSFDNRKNVMFLVPVIQEIVAQGVSPKGLLVGDGPLLSECLKGLQGAGCIVVHKGYLRRQELVPSFGSAKMLLLPSLLDAWGVVTNEALASGTPVICSRFCGAADELVREGENGFVLDLDAGLWAMHMLRLLRDPGLWNQFSHCAVQSVAQFTCDVAADGILSACRSVLAPPHSIAD